MRVAAPLTGDVVDLTDVPDAVFSAQMLGAGLAIEPGSGPTEVLAPVSGTLAKVHPHAFVVVTDEGVGVLVHLGIDTVGLEGEGFTVHAAEGDEISAGAPVVTFDPDLVRSRDLSAVCPVVLMEAEPDSATDRASGPVRAGRPLFSWTA
ncbi:PTS glucose transporter subunit IIA [Pseudonocardia sp. KRD-291]|nr:PTS glucose transporter subunit IIA [Pseudonocardia sp. KRD291]